MDGWIGELLQCKNLLHWPFPIQVRDRVGPISDNLLGNEIWKFKNVKKLCIKILCSNNKRNPWPWLFPRWCNESGWNKNPPRIILFEATTFAETSVTLSATSLPPCKRNWPFTHTRKVARGYASEHKWLILMTLIHHNHHDAQCAHECAEWVGITVVW